MNVPWGNRLYGVRTNLKVHTGLHKARNPSGQESEGKFHARSLHPEKGKGTKFQNRKFVACCAGHMAAP